MGSERDEGAGLHGVGVRYYPHGCIAYELKAAFGTVWHA